MTTGDPPAYDGSQPSSLHIKWHNRLGTRLAALFALLMVVSFWAAPAVSEAARSLLGWMAPEEITSQGPFNFTPEKDLRRSRVDAAGNLVPAAEDLQSLDDRMRPFGEAFVLLDNDQRVVGSSSTLPLARGAHWPHGTSLFAELAMGDGGSYRSVCTDLEIGGNKAGWLIEIILDEEEHARAYHDDPLGEEEFEPEKCYFFPRENPFADSERARTIKKRASFLRRSTYGLTIALSVLMLSMVTSRLMTRRLRKLSDQALAAPSDGQSLPGPFLVHGQTDEISALATSMNHMRDRVGDLLDTLETRDRSRREWIAQVSHDLRTPLTALMACLDRLKRASPSGEQGKELQSLLDTAELDARRVVALADDLLYIARLDAGTKPVAEPVPPAELVRRTVATLEPLSSAKGIRLLVDLTPKMPLIQADGRLLTRALENLIANAAQHARAQIIVRGRSNRFQVEISVLDDGPGFPEDDGRVNLEALAGTQSRADSSGLGLVVAKRVAQAHGGELLAENRPEGGACVRLVLPIICNPEDSA